MNNLQACIFDMDGVLVSTEKYHFLAWKELAESLGFTIDEVFNEQLKGVSRAVCIDLILQHGGIDVSADEKQHLSDKKNTKYLKYISTISRNDVLPGVVSLLEELRKHGIKTAVGSASKNAPFLLEKLELTTFFDVLVDGTQISQPKPHPEVFLKGAEKMAVQPQNCIVFEDAQSGVQAAKSAGMYCVGIGNPAILSEADMCVNGVYEISYLDLAIL
ncbi:MAG: beta-phosphoglucomutase [Bacteroidales bacterium]|jgi:beta-phosphoglucomutase|nr:beta-phosphoglucomutase [Bacteroidales bacterium]